MKTLSLAFGLLFSLSVQAQYKSQVWCPDNGDGTYTNPVLFADYSDPDVCAVGDDYYLTASSFNCIPGLPILHSRDLVNWTIIGHALQEQLPKEIFDQPQHGKGVWAPAIRHHNGLFYIYWGDPDLGIFMVQSERPDSGWSLPVCVISGRGMIDPCPLWDDDGRCYLVNGWAASRAGLNSVLTVRELSADGTRAIGKPRIVFDGGQENFTSEGPKFYKRDGYYWIMNPAGGVEMGWQLAMRSKSPYGPYEWRRVMWQGKTTVNGPHQGAWVHTSQGEDWFLHFNDRFAYRRVGYTTNGQMVTAASEAGIGLEVDKLNRKGVKAHFDRFLGPLLDELKEYCGTTLRYVVVDSWEAGRQDYTELLGEDYLTAGDGKDFLTGGIDKPNKTKERLFMREFVEPLKEELRQRGLLLVGEPYGNGDFDRKTYGLSLDLPMSEYWARSHYGTIERPYFVSRYGHTAGRSVIGCEFGTAYPGDADIPATLSSFRRDIDKVCSAGVNFFVLHCIAHQDCDDRPLTMGPFGTRFDRLHANVDSVRAITDYIRQRINLQQKRVTFDCAVEIEDGRHAYLRLPRGHEVVKAVLYCHQNMTEEVLFRSKIFCQKMDSLGVAMAFMQRGSQNWDVSMKDDKGKTCQERFEQIMEDFARGSEHPELATCPIIPFGHSAQATFPWNFAAWNPDRTLCVISYHGDAPRTNLCGYGRANVEWGRTRNIDFIPGLMIEGEYEWWEARVRPALAFRMMYPDSRISFLCDAGKGHFDLCEETQDYMARFIAKALKDPRPKGGVYYSRWREDGVESQDPHDQFWYQDEEMVSLARARYQQSQGKQMQYVSAIVNRQPVTYNPDSHIKLKTTIPCDSSQGLPIITVTPVFTDSTHNAKSACHAQVRPRVVLISGPAIQTGEYTFRYDPDYFGFDPKRLWDGITLCIEANGDGEYKSAVQELNIQIKR